MKYETQQEWLEETLGAISEKFGLDKSVITEAYKKEWSMSAEWESNYYTQKAAFLAGLKGTWIHLPENPKSEMISTNNLDVLKTKS